MAKFALQLTIGRAEENKQDLNQNEINNKITLQVGPKRKNKTSIKTKSTIKS